MATDPTIEAGLRAAQVKQFGPDAVADLISPKLGLTPGQCSTDSVFLHEQITKAIETAAAKGEVLSYRDAARKVAEGGA